MHLGMSAPPFLQKLKLCKLPNLWCSSELSRYFLAVSVMLNHQLLHLIDSHWELSSQLLCSPWLASRDVHKKDPTFLAQSWSNVSSRRARLCNIIVSGLFLVKLLVAYHLWELCCMLAEIESRQRICMPSVFEQWSCWIYGLFSHFLKNDQVVACLSAESNEK